MDVWEERTIDPRDYGATGIDRVPVKRELAQAMIPGKHLVKVEIERAVYDQRK